MGLIVVAIIVVALSMLAMAVGVIFSNRCLRGSCGGTRATGPDSEVLGCESCPRQIR